MSSQFLHDYDYYFTFCHVSLYIVPLTSLFIIVHMLLLYLMYQYWSERINWTELNWCDNQFFAVYKITMLLLYLLKVITSMNVHMNLANSKSVYSSIKHYVYTWLPNITVLALSMTKVIFLHPTKLYFIFMYTSASNFPAFIKRVTFCQDCNNWLKLKSSISISAQCL